MALESGPPADGPQAASWQAVYLQVLARAFALLDGLRMVADRLRGARPPRAHGLRTAHMRRPGQPGPPRSAAHVGLNPSYLSTLFRCETDLTVTGYVQRERVTTAKNMLKHSGHTATQISTALGFASQSHFTRAFREETELTPPTDYRRRFHHSTGFGKWRGPYPPFRQLAFGGRA